MDKISSKDALLSGSAFSRTSTSNQDSDTKIHANSSVKYDLVGKLVSETGLTRKNIVNVTSFKKGFSSFCYF